MVKSYDTTNVDLLKLKYKLFRVLLENCYIDQRLGTFHCKKCKCVVHIDWHRNLAFCEGHIFSHMGVTPIEELYKNALCSFNNPVSECEN